MDRQKIRLQKEACPRDKFKEHTYNLTKAIIYVLGLHFQKPTQKWGTLFRHSSSNDGLPKKMSYKRTLYFFMNCYFLVIILHQYHWCQSGRGKMYKSVPQKQPQTHFSWKASTLNIVTKHTLLLKSLFFSQSPKSSFTWDVIFAVVKEIQERTYTSKTWAICSQLYPRRELAAFVEIYITWRSKIKSPLN